MIGKNVRIEEKRVLVKVVHQRSEELRLTNGLQKMIRSPVRLCGCVMTRLIEITFPRSSVLFVVAFRTSFEVKNFNPAFIIGSKNLRTSSFKDDVASDMRQHAMVLYKKKPIKWWYFRLCSNHKGINNT